MEVLEDLTGWVEISITSGDFGRYNSKWSKEHYAIRFENGVKKEEIIFKNTSSESWIGDPYYGYKPTTDKEEIIGENPEDYNFVGSYEELYGYGDSDYIECVIMGVEIPPKLALKMLGIKKFCGFYN